MLFWATFPYVNILGGSKNLKIYESWKVQCNLCEVEVSFKNVDQHRKLRCNICNHHHHNHGQADQCCRWIRHCRKCGPFGSRRLRLVKKKRCDCGHYHAVPKAICPSSTSLRSSAVEPNYDTESTIQSTVKESIVSQPKLTVANTARVEELKFIWRKKT